MGEPMVQRLLSSGFEVFVWNRTRSKIEGVVAAGAKAAANLPEMSAHAEITLTMVSDDAAVKEIYLGSPGLLSAKPAGKLFIDMSTILPDTARRVASAAIECGSAFIDAPVAGTVQPAREGRLLILAGGDPRDIERAQPVFAALGRKTDHVGPAGSGAAMKLVHNTLLTTEWAILAESLSMGSRYGLDLKRMLDVILESPAAFAAIPVKMPLLVGASTDIGFDINNVQKDLRTIRQFAESLKVDAGVSKAAASLYRQAVDAGFGKEDVASIVKFYGSQTR
jgi:3-hydroxyisobutyrate dehydrogenase